MKTNIYFWPYRAVRMRNVSDKSCTEISKHMNLLTFSRKMHRLWENVDNYCTAGQTTGVETICRMRFACLVPKATNTEYVIIIVFPLQQWLREHVSMLYYTFIDWLV